MIEGEKARKMCEGMKSYKKKRSLPPVTSFICRSLLVLPSSGFCKMESMPWCKGNEVQCGPCGGSMKPMCESEVPKHNYLICNMSTLWQNARTKDIWYMAIVMSRSSYPQILAVYHFSENPQVCPKSGSYNKWVGYGEAEMMATWRFRRKKMSSD